MHALKIALLIIAGLLNFGFGVAVIQRDIKKLNNVSFFILMTAIAGWTLGVAGFLAVNDESVALGLAKVYYFFPLLIAVGLVLFVRSFPNYPSVSGKVSIPLLLGFFALAAPLVLDRSFVTGYLEYHEWGKEIVLSQVSYAFYSVYLLMCYCGSIYVMYRKSKDEAGIYGLQAGAFFKGFLVTAIFSLTFNLIMPWFGNYRLIWLGPIFTAAFLMSIAYGIVKHSMFSLRTFFARSLAYVFALSVLLVGYSVLSQFVVIYVLKNGQQVSGYSPVDTILIVFAILSYGFIKRFFDRVTNAVFYHDSYDSQKLIDELNKVLVSTINLNDMLRLSSEVIEYDIKPEFCVFGLKETEFAKQRVVGNTRIKFSSEDINYARKITPHIDRKVIIADYLGPDSTELLSKMRTNNVSVLVRLTSDISLEGIGYIVLGPKKSGNTYNKQDTQVLEIIANTLVIAIQNALRFEEIQQFNLTLQERIERATKQLKRANDKLVTLNNTKDDFISMASHQLRTPLTAVKGNISMVLDGDYGKFPKPLREPLGQAFNSSERMVGLIADLLNVSRLRTGKFAIQPVSSNLDAVVQSELEQLKETTRGRNLKLTYDRPKGFPTVMLDEIKIRQVIMNFIDNAIYYTPSGGWIKVALKHSSKAIEFTVEDNGIGVPRDLQHHLFTKFYRASNAQKMRPDGTGIGLFMAKKVIIASGGSVIFKSTEGKGSTFGFTIPLAKLIDAQPIVVTDEPTLE